MNWKFFPFWVLLLFVLFLFIICVIYNRNDWRKMLKFNGNKRKERNPFEEIRSSNLHFFEKTRKSCTFWIFLLIIRMCSRFLFIFFQKIHAKKIHFFCSNFANSKSKLFEQKKLPIQSKIFYNLLKHSKSFQKVKILPARLEWW